MEREKIILLNAVVPPKSDGFVSFRYISTEEAIRLIREAKEVVSYVGHPSTAYILSQLSGKDIQVNRGEYIPTSGDVAIVVRLKKRLEKPGEAQVTIGDLEFLLVKYLL
jgi:hypothetical protein